MIKPDVLNFIANLVSIPENADVLDVGCQNEDTLLFFKNRFNIKGKLIGIDKFSKNFCNEQQQMALGVKLIPMNASETISFDDGSFDVILHFDTLECIKDINTHINDLHRLLKKDGMVICVHQDWESIALNGNNKALINKCIYGYANFLQESWMDCCDGWIGRRLWGYFNSTGLFEGSIHCYNKIETEYVEGTRGYEYIHDMNSFLLPKGFLSQSEYNDLLNDIQETYIRGEYIFSRPFYIYIGRKK